MVGSVHHAISTDILILDFSKSELKFASELNRNCFPWSKIHPEVPAFTRLEFGPNFNLHFEIRNTVEVFEDYEA